MNTKNQKVLFIGGLGRSGSTLIEKLVNEFPGTFALGETLHLWERGIRDNEKCSCGEQFDACPHWQAVGELAFGGWQNIDLEKMISLRWKTDRSRSLPKIIRAHHTGEISPDQDEYISHLGQVINASAEIAGHPDVLIESSKHLSTAALMSLEPSLDVRVVHLIRDPRGVSYSWTKKIDRPETDGEFMPRYKARRTATRWVTDNLGFEFLNKSLQSEIVRYETFLDEPEQVLETIANLIDIDISGVKILSDGKAKITQDMHSVAGNPMRFNAGDELVLRKDEAWRKRLSTRDKLVVTTICAPLMLRYGYKLN